MTTLIDRRRRARRRHRRSGFTLVETLVAIVLIEVGLLALVTASALVVRQTADVRQRTRAVRLASNRLELLGATACAPSTGHAVVAPDMEEIWAVDTAGNGIRELRDSVTFLVHGLPRAVALRTKLPC